MHGMEACKNKLSVRKVRSKWFSLVQRVHFSLQKLAKVLLNVKKNTTTTLEITKNCRLELLQQAATTTILENRWRLSSLQPSCQGSDLLSVGHLIIACDQVNDSCVISKLDDGL